VISDHSGTVVGIYRRHAAAWASGREAVAFVEGRWIDRLLALLPAASRILDLGCAPGIPMGRYLADRGHALTGVDSAPEMISMFRPNLPTHVALVCDMRSLVLAARFDGVIAGDSRCGNRSGTFTPVFGLIPANGATAAGTSFNGPIQGTRLR
jgi:SAM-dependent methyltransferase